MNQTAQPIPIGIIGLNFGKYILEHFEKPDAKPFFKLAAVCDLDEAKAKDFAKKYGVAAHTSIDSLLADSNIPVVGLFTGPVGRAGLLRQIIRAGKDVMTTKPFELDPVAARSILEEAHELGRIIHLNSPSPHPSSAIVKIKEWEKTYDLGKPIFCRGEVTVSYREKADGSWYDDPARCPVPPIFRLGIYTINDLVRLFGRVKEVQVTSSRIFTGRPTADNAQLGMLFENGAVGSIYASFCIDNGQYYANSLILHYERGSIHHNMDPTDYGQAGKDSRLKLFASAGNEKLVREEWTSPENTGNYQWQVLHDAIVSRDIDDMPIDEVVQGIEVIEAMVRADKSRQTEIIQTHT